MDKELTPHEVNVIMHRRFSQKHRYWNVLVAALAIVGFALILAPLMTVLASCDYEGESCNSISTIGWVLLSWGSIILAGLLAWGIVYTERQKEYKEKMTSEWFKKGA